VDHQRRRPDLADESQRGLGIHACFVPVAADDEMPADVRRADERARVEVGPLDDRSGEPVLAAISHAVR